MSFQGDVAGIGLGELLQGLARGGKDGVLTLYGDGDLTARLGLQGSQVYLLEGPDEDPDQWRLRADRAWFLAPDPGLDADRRESIARSSRREALFQMLEAPNLHFRFEPGPLPSPKGRLDSGSSFQIDDPFGGQSPWGPGVGVEFLLLEYARIADESSADARPEEYDVPVLLQQIPEGEAQSIGQQIDGCSTVLEIADRVGWPVLQARGALSELITKGVVRVATHEEQLALGHAELEADRFDRAALHLIAWLDKAPAGPPLHAEAELVYDCWEGGLIRRTLPDLGHKYSRTLMRKLDLIDPDLDRQIDRWRELAQLAEAPQVAKLHYHALRTRLPQDQRQGADSELLRIARHCLARGQFSRAQSILRVVSELAPASLGTRIELGTRLLEADLVDLGADWMVEAAQELIVSGDYERAIAVLHSLLQSAPNHRVANGMLLETRERVRRKARRRWHTLAAVSLAVIVSGAGVVRFQISRDREAKLVEITDILDQPDQAIAMLEKYFPTDDSQRVIALRLAVHKRKQAEQESQASAWLGRFESIESMIRSGNLTDAYGAIVELPKPPDSTTSGRRDWGTQGDLLTKLANELEKQADQEDPGLEATPAQLEEEAKVLETIEEIATAAKTRRSVEPFGPFAQRTLDLAERVSTRRVERAVDLEVRDRKNHESLQEQHLAAARQHSAAGELIQSLEDYDALLELDTDGSLAPILAVELDEVRQQKKALDMALDQARAGQHTQALATLVEAHLDPGIFLLPWRVTSTPAGAQVLLSDGTTHTTPFAMDSAAGSPLRLEFTMEGTEGARLEVDRPGDVHVMLHRSPERVWVSERLVEAIPVAIGGDEIIADRLGRVDRIDPSGEVIWTRELETLGGISRTPRFLPSRPGTLLVLSEDGKAWLIDAETGEAEGPWASNSAPKEGLLNLRNVSLAALFDDGNMAIWEDGLIPRVQSARSLLDQPDYWQDENGSEIFDHAKVLRRGTSEASDLGSSWNAWRIEVLDDRYLVRKSGREPETFTIRRVGRWQFVAWERPSALAENGRLWVSDESGLRSFLP